MLTSVILGAGFSHTAGLPLTKDLFIAEAFIVSARAAARFSAVENAWQAWQTANPGAATELFLKFLYNSAKPPVPWQWTVEFVAAVLATPNSDDLLIAPPRYAQRITRPIHCITHTDFWNVLLMMHEVAAVVTTNYDVLAERALRHKQMRRPVRPGMYYGGLPRPQVLRGRGLPGRDSGNQRLVELTGSIPVYKLHGSLNWAIDSSRSRLELFQDLRPAFRRGCDAAIVPPLPEKDIPIWLRSVWAEAEHKLALSRSWIVCGYSLPDYDAAIRAMLSRAAAGNVETIFILDPYSQSLRGRWQAIASAASIICLPGLPEALAVFDSPFVGS